MVIDGGTYLLHQMCGLDGTALKIGTTQFESLDRENNIPCVAVDYNWVRFYLTIGRNTT